eukprot:CAMPEP_0204324726 /NCGR_PEP_ID=MMETSP0469-20131031/10458_1 /ASSEMBLY_ACC=CAM_ASM_000384 /TAXON_ID=2969 /ORGANISM="Oxyrrhis marina" /LENGTH=361 /DNA_ID=CAMNT_0051306437 /DNA_START=75 /DNA_END=1160 /DNA_ORIENTATION=-
MAAEVNDAPTSSSSQKTFAVRRQMGNTRFLCGGRLTIGADCGAFAVGAWVMIVLPSILFHVNTAVYFFDDTPVVITIGLVLTVISVVSFVCTVFSDPGVLPRREDPKETFDEAAHLSRRQSPPRTQNVIVHGNAVTLKWCHTCNIYRPPRSSHCSVCDTCVERFDHHCPWVGNCIGQRNYYLFYTFVTSTAILTVYCFSFVVAHVCRRVDERHGDTEDLGKELLQVLQDEWASAIVAGFTLCIMWFTCGLFGYHTYLIATSQTTYEQLRGPAPGLPTSLFGHGPLSNFFHILCFPVRPVLLDTVNKTVRQPRLKSTLVRPGVTKLAPAASPIAVGRPGEDDSAGRMPDGVGVGDMNDTLDA